jgi:hypothetical protein
LKSKSIFNYLQVYSTLCNSKRFLLTFCQILYFKPCNLYVYYNVSFQYWFILSFFPIRNRIFFIWTLFFKPKFGQIAFKVIWRERVWQRERVRRRERQWEIASVPEQKFWSHVYTVIRIFSMSLNIKKKLKPTKKVLTKLKKYWKCKRAPMNTDICLRGNSNHLSFRRVWFQCNEIGS